MQENTMIICSTEQECRNDETIEDFDLFSLKTFFSLKIFILRKLRFVIDLRSNSTLDCIEKSTNIYHALTMQSRMWRYS